MLDQQNRPCKVWRHKLGSLRKHDTMVYEELDDAFSVSVCLTSDNAMLMILSGEQSSNVDSPE